MLRHYKCRQTRLDLPTRDAAQIEFALSQFSDCLTFIFTTSALKTTQISLVSLRVFSGDLISKRQGQVATSLVLALAIALVSS